MGGAVTRTRCDHFGKQMVRDALEGHCSIESDAEVHADTRRIDLWVTPRDLGTSPPEHLGLLGRITCGSIALEFVHNTPKNTNRDGASAQHGSLPDTPRSRPYATSWPRATVAAVGVADDPG